MRARSSLKLLLPVLLLAVLAILPFATDGGQAECCNVTTSLASTAAGQVRGDEAFFSLPSGPANVMLLLDDSGSMAALPPCGNGWGSGKCANPTVPSPTAPSSTGSGTPLIYYTVNGTCHPSTLSANLAWMEKVVPKEEYADPGRTNAIVTDNPPWGIGCTGDNCLFDPKAYYWPDGWRSSTSGAADSWPSATRVAHDTDTTKSRGCYLISNAGAYIRDRGSNNIYLGADCETCMTDHGYYFYRVRYYDTGGTLRSPSTALLFKGTFLNAFPPKFVSAKRVIKDVAFLDPANPTKLDQVRFGLTRILDSATTPARARLVVPLGPDKLQSFPPTQQGFAQARQYILSVLNYDKAVYKDAAGNVIVDGPTLTGFFDPANSMTPLGTALLNVGQYFSSANQFDNVLLGKKCNTNQTCQSASFNESSAGDVNAPWARSNPNQCSICWACQNNAVLMISDGAPNSEISLPAAITGYDNVGYASVANCGATGGCASAVVPRVADWLHYADLRSDAVMTGKQALVVHTVGINIDKATTPVEYNVLNATANLSGGIFQSASDPAELANAVVNAINKVVPKENSFSASSASSLQTVQTAAAQAFLTRFKPNETPTWEGHVFETFLFDEAGNGCDEKLAIQPQVMCQGRSISADFNEDGSCGGVFQIDSDCDEISEDPATGDFVKKGTTDPANIAWDAGRVLSDPTKVGYRSADETATNARTIFTSINGAKVAFTAANAATLQPFMNISAAWCTSFLTQIGVAGGTNPTLTCAQQIIYFVRGWDVLNQDYDLCGGPANPKNTVACKSGLKGEERDRANDSSATPFFWKLGDIFHSSPGILNVAASPWRCETGAEQQCLATLWSPDLYPNQTPIEFYVKSGTFKVNAYERHRLDTANRKRIVIVGANDGMLHAFEAGAADTSQPADLTGTYPYTVGTGEELWAFVPPDLLPRLKDLTSGHQYMVDGSVMLRDVWVDGSGSEIPAADGKKQKDEYHSVAVFGRRSGGTAHSALDVTDPTNPKILWTFPKDCTDDAQYMGESWAEFAPLAPPIVPVKIASTTDARGFEERWVVMINGGYDPMLNLGRAVFMLDVWTGETLWRFTDADFKANTGYGPGTSMFPITAAIGMVDIGEPTRPDIDSDGFFDTATWGDLGGNLWVARFHEPGVRATSGAKRVTNWYAARTFEQQRQTDDSQRAANRNEFFFMTANVYEPSSRTLRTLAGSGNRERIMGQAASCGTDNLLACAQAGCTKVTSTTTNNYGACNGTTTFSATNGVYSYATGTTASCGTTPATCASGANFSSNLSVHWECPGAGTVLDAAGSASCDASGLCTVIPMPERSVSGTFTAPSHNRFYGVWAYGKDAKKKFKDAATALAFDKNRFTDVTYSVPCTGPPGGTCTLVDVTTASVTYAPGNRLRTKTTCGAGVTKCSADTVDAGWFYQYGDVCPLASCVPPPPWTDEKTGSGADVLLGCTLWGTFRPVGVTTSTNPCSGSLGVPVTYGYAAHAVTGTPNAKGCGITNEGVVIRARQRAITSPPNPPTIRIVFPPGAKPKKPGDPPTPPVPPGGCAQGIGYSTLSLDAGSAAAKTPIGTRTCATEPIYMLELPRDEHICRHKDATKCE